MMFKFEIGEWAYFINSPQAVISEIGIAKNRIEEIIESRITKGKITEIIINKNGVYYRLKAYNFEGVFTIIEQNLKRSEYEAKQHFLKNYINYLDTVYNGYDYTVKDNRGDK